MKINKFKYRKVDEKKKLHKVKKQWVVLGVSALAFLAVETAPDVADNHSFLGTDVVAKADATPSTPSASATPATTNESLVSSAPAVANVAGYIPNGSSSSSSGTISQSSSITFTESPVSTSASSSSTPVYHAEHYIVRNGYDSSTSYATATIYLNDSNGNSPLNDSVVSDITNLKFYYKQDSSASENVYSVADSDVNSYVHFIKSASNMSFSYSKTSSDSAIASNVSALLIDFPSNYYSYAFGSGAEAGLSYDLSSTASNASYSEYPIYDTFNVTKYSNGSSSTTTSIGVGLGTPTSSIGIKAIANNRFNAPVNVSYVDKSGQSLAVSGTDNKYLTGDNIYLGNSFSFSAPSLSGYQFLSASGNFGSISSTNNQSGASITGVFANSYNDKNEYFTQTATLTYGKVINDTFSYVTDDGSNVVDSKSFSGLDGSNIDTSTLTIAPSGYTYDSSNASNTYLNSALSFGSSDASYKIYVTKNSPVVISSVTDTFTYVTSDGTEVGSSVATSGLPGSSVDTSGLTSSSVPTGYTYDSSNASNSYLSSAFNFGSSAASYKIYVTKNAPAVANSVTDTFAYVTSAGSVVGSYVVTGLPSSAVASSGVISSVPSGYDYDASNSANSYLSSAFTFGSSNGNYKVYVTAKTTSTNSTSNTGSTVTSTTYVASSAASSSANYNLISSSASSTAVSSSATSSSVASSSNAPVADFSQEVIIVPGKKASATTTKHHKKTTKKHTSKSNNKVKTTKKHFAHSSTTKNKKGTSFVKSTKHSYKSTANGKRKLPQTGENNVVKQASLVGLAMIALSGLFAGLYKRQK